MTDLHVKMVEPRDPRLKRHVVHDPQSRAFAKGLAIHPATWRTRVIRLWDPRTNPNQPVGNCTTCAKAMQMNAAGNHVPGVVFNMDQALDWYELETLLDPFPGYFKRGDPASEDTGSNGLASCKVAQQVGVGGEYRWFFGGADEIAQYFSTDPDPIPVSNGTWWYQGMFNLQRKPGATYRGLSWVEPTGNLAGGHQYITRGYVEPLDAFVDRCWWGPHFRDFLIKREHKAELLADDGDAHTQERVIV